MANLLLTAADWKNAANVSPPPQWNGSAWVFADVDSLTLTATAAAGDTLAGAFTGTRQGEGHQVDIFVNGVNATGWGADTISSFPDAIAITLAAGDTVGILLSADRCGYLPDFTLTPTTPPPPPPDTRNCDCDDTTGNKTLAQLRRDLMVRLGFAAQADNPPPGMTDLLNSFLIEAQELLYRRYDVLRTERFYSWSLQSGVKFYDINDNAETCTKRLDPRKVTWCGVQMDDTWYPLECGIPPELYSGNPNGWPQRYEVRQCIEVWPTPDQTNGTLIIKGHFGLEAFAADDDPTTIDDRLVFLLALANAKAHYGRPDANNYIAQMEQMMLNLVAGSHETRRYIPGRPRMFDMVYTAPKPTVPFT
jgi:hypothetical protein